MTNISGLIVKKLVPVVGFNKINSVHLLKNVENVCEHIFEVSRYSVQRTRNKPHCNGLIKRMELRREPGKACRKERIKGNYMSHRLKRSNEMFSGNKMFRKVYQYMDKAIVLLPEFGPSGILRLLYAMLKIKNFEKSKRRKMAILKYIEYYLLKISVNDETYDFWKYVTMNDLVLLFKMFILNDYFSHDLLSTLVQKIVKSAVYVIPTDSIIFLWAYHIYKQKKKPKRYIMREVVIPQKCILTLCKNVVNNFDFTNKDMSRFMFFYSSYGCIMSSQEQVEIYTKSFTHMKKMALAYSPEQVKRFLLSLFRIRNFAIRSCTDVGNYYYQHVNTWSELVKKLFELYNKRNMDIGAEGELHILSTSLRNGYYDYDSLENILFNIKNNISHLRSRKQIKFINAVIKMRKVHIRGGDIVDVSAQKIPFIDCMLRQILNDSISFINQKFKFVPWKFRNVLLKYKMESLLHGFTMPNASILDSCV
ncbi:conserved Plasmodium protein, unknown function [Plasmodium ovale]|uniref:RAP protein n=2 Tax=Plasmodium ovale TaxID=36330 RepID=A0A1A8WID6_PLAOA|nr:conserved Plasmodium protein, unknown function [Plasmodium ovale curtisi]SBS92688.1 conserved Plasmodium protein, unknown function [Plasmodium ovale curtisi]SCQ16494.1 conserved Plasmodium protein, unknown function [Plasmodium ovale]